MRTKALGSVVQGVVLTTLHVPLCPRFFGLILNRGSSLIPKHWHNYQSFVHAPGSYSPVWFEHRILLSFLLLALNICWSGVYTGGSRINKVEIASLCIEFTTLSLFAVTSSSFCAHMGPLCYVGFFFRN